MAAADLSVTAVMGPDPAYVGDLVTITATVTNNGDEPATNAAVSFGQFTNVDFDQASGCQAIFDVLAQCPLGDIPPGRVVTKSMTVRVPIRSLNDNASAVVNASHEDAEGGTAPDPTPSDNSTVVSIRVEQKGDIKLEIGFSRPTVRTGEQVAVITTISNPAAGPARAARLQVQLPAGLTLLTLPPGCGAAGLLVTCELGDVASQQTLTRSIQLGAPSEGAFVVSGSVGWSREDPTPADNRAQATVTAEAPPVLPPPPAPAKIQVKRAQVKQGRLDALVQITSRATGSLRFAYTSRGMTTSFSVPIARSASPSARAAETQIKVNRLLPGPQRRKSTGILEITYLGSPLVSADQVRLRAARGRALLRRTTTEIDEGMLKVAGTVSGASVGIVRIRLSYVATDNTIAERHFRARIVRERKASRNTWKMAQKLPARAVEVGGQVDIQYTGYEKRLIRGEQLSKQVR